MGMLCCHAVKVYSPFPLTFLWFFLSITTRVIQQTLILSPTMNQVMEYIGITAIPDKDIMQRWTRDAQDVLPMHLWHYQRDKAAGNVMTYRHSTLYMLAMEAVS